jgi:hypothetical protein
MEDQELDQIIRKIDEKIRALQTARKVLLEEFGKGQRAASLSFVVHEGELERPKHETRKDTIIRILREHGPLKVIEIKEKTGFSRGTIGWVLNDKETFKSLGGGKWDVVEHEHVIEK